MAPNQKAGRVGKPTDHRSDGAQRVMEQIRALNLTFEGTLTAANSPVLIEFNAAQGWNAIQGHVINDGNGDLKWQFTRDGTTYGSIATMLPAENMNMKGLDVHTIRLIHTGTDLDYRVFLV